MTEKKENNIHYYVYKLVNPITNEFYFGSRKSKKLPQEDNYYGSMKTWEVDKSKLIKTIIKSDFLTHEETILFESDLIRSNINNPLNRNYNIPNIGFYTKGKNCSGEKNSFYNKKHSENHKKYLSKISNGENNPSYGKKWINNGVEMKYVYKSDLASYLSNGWVLGNIKSDNFNTSNRRWVNNGEKMLYVMVEDLYNYLNNGWVLGRIITDKMMACRKKISENSKGRVNKSGYKLKNLKWVNKNGVVKRIWLNELGSYLNNGWVLGRK